MTIQFKLKPRDSRVHIMKGDDTRGYLEVGTIEWIDGIPLLSRVAPAVLFTGKELHYIAEYIEAMEYSENTGG